MTAVSTLASWLAVVMGKCIRALKLVMTATRMILMPVGTFVSQPNAVMGLLVETWRPENPVLRPAMMPTMFLRPAFTGSSLVWFAMGHAL